MSERTEQRVRYGKAANTRCGNARRGLESLEGDGIYLLSGNDIADEQSSRCAEEAMAAEGVRLRSADMVRHMDLIVYQRAFAEAMAVFKATQSFPPDERYSLTDQIRRSSRSVSANIGEAWRKRRYAASFVSKLNGAEGEAGETQVWLQFAVECEYLTVAEARSLYGEYDQIIRMLLHMQTTQQTGRSPNDNRRSLSHCLIVSSSHRLIVSLSALP